MKVLKKVLMVTLSLFVIWFVGTWLYDRYGGFEKTLNPVSCIGEGKIYSAISSMGPKHGGPYGKCCNGLTPGIRPGWENLDGAAVYCLKK